LWRRRTSSRAQERSRNCADHATSQKNQGPGQGQPQSTPIPLGSPAQGVLNAPFDQRQRLIGRLSGALDKKRHLGRVVFRR
jgi:hypothetical protein